MQMQVTDSRLTLPYLHGVHVTPLAYRDLRALALMKKGRWFFASRLQKLYLGRRVGDAAQRRATTISRGSEPRDISEVPRVISCRQRDFPLPLHPRGHRPHGHPPNLCPPLRQIHGDVPSIYVAAENHSIAEPPARRVKVALLLRIASHALSATPPLRLGLSTLFLPLTKPPNALSHPPKMIPPDGTHDLIDQRRPMTNRLSAEAA